MKKALLWTCWILWAVAMVRREWVLAGLAGVAIFFALNIRVEAGYRDLWLRRLKDAQEWARRNR